MTFYEIIERLIDVGEVPEGSRDGDEYEQARETIHQNLSSPEAVRIACYHEAGHWVQAQRAALRLGLDGTGIEVVGPKIRFKTELAPPYDPAPTGIVLPGAADWLPQSDAELGMMAEIAVAGGEAVLAFFDENTPRGDRDDRRRFLALQMDARLRLGGEIRPAHEYCQAAIDIVGPDFQLIAIRERIETKAKQVMMNQFRPVFHSDT